MVVGAYVTKGSGSGAGAGAGANHACSEHWEQPTQPAGMILHAFSQPKLFATHEQAASHCKAAPDAAAAAAKTWGSAAVVVVVVSDSRDSDIASVIASDAETGAAVDGAMP